MKIDAARLLLDNTDNTFVTSVFNGSTSLRSAAGQLIEDVNKSVRRGQTVDDAYLDNLFEEVSGLVEAYNHTIAEKANDVDAFFDIYAGQLVQFNSMNVRDGMRLLVPGEDKLESKLLLTAAE